MLKLIGDWLVHNAILVIVHFEKDVTVIHENSTVLNECEEACEKWSLTKGKWVK